MKRLRKNIPKGAECAMKTEFDFKNYVIIHA